MLIDINAMVFGTPRTLFPAIDTEVLGGGAGVVGLLYSAPAAGAFIGALTSGWVGRMHRQGLAVIVAAAGWGAAIAAVAFVTSLWGVLVLLALAGLTDIISEVFRSTISQVVVPDSLRGRISALFIVQVTGVPRVGDVESGVVGGRPSARNRPCSSGAWRSWWAWRSSRPGAHRWLDGGSTPSGVLPKRGSLST